MPYIATEDLRSLDPDEVWTDEQLAASVEYAEEVIDTYCGTSFEFKTWGPKALDGTNSNYIILPKMFIRTLSCTVDGTSAQTSGWRIYDTGECYRGSDGFFNFTSPGGNVVVSGTAGYTSAAGNSIEWAARVIAMGWLMSSTTRIPDRALSVNSEFGQIQLAQAGGNWRPTEYPPVNSILNQYRFRPPAL